jgi:cob(I)alamin adenosyltransferase
MIIVFTGNGKGKTTAALGQAVRAMGHGRRVHMIQCIKGPWISGEDEFTAKIRRQGEILDSIPGRTDLKEGLAPFYDFQIRKMGLGFVGILGDQLPREAHEDAARGALAAFREAVGSGTWDMVILDEVNVALSLGLLTIESVLFAIAEVPDEMLAVLTGRGAPEELIDAADLVTEMREIKHPFNDGRYAKKMIEF